MLTNDPYEYVLLFLDVIVHYVMLYMYAEKPNKFKFNSVIVMMIDDDNNNDNNGFFYEAHSPSCKMLMALILFMNSNQIDYT